MGDLVERGMTHNEKQAVGYTFVAHSLNHGLDLVYGAVLVVVALEFEASLALLGIIATVSGLIYGFVALPAGALADRVGSKLMLVLSLGGSGVAAVLAAVSPNITVLAVALALMGFLGGMYHPAGLAFIARSVRTRARAMGYHGMGGNLGAAVAPLIAGGIAGVWSWRASFVVFAVLSVAVALLVQFSSVTEGTSLRQVGTPTLGSHRRPLPAVRTLIVPLVLAFMLNAFLGFVYRGAVTFLPLHLATNIGFRVLGFEPVVVGGIFATLALLFGVGGQYIGGELGERFRRELVIIPMIMVTVPALLLVGSTNGLVLLVAAAAFVFFYFMSAPSYNALIVDYTAAHIQGRVFGFMFMAAFGFGSFAGIAGGVVAERVGISAVFIMLAGFGFLSTLVSLVLFAYVRSRGEYKVRAWGSHSD